MTEVGNRLTLCREVLLTEVVLCSNCAIRDDSWTCCLVFRVNNGAAGLEGNGVARTLP